MPVAGCSLLCRLCPCPCSFLPSHCTMLDHFRAWLPPTQPRLIRPDVAACRTHATTICVWVGPSRNALSGQEQSACSVHSYRIEKPKSTPVDPRHPPLHTAGQLPALQLPPAWQRHCNALGTAASPVQRENRQIIILSYSFRCTAASSEPHWVAPASSVADLLPQLAGRTTRALAFIGHRGLISRLFKSQRDVFTRTRVAEGKRAGHPVASLASARGQEPG